MSNLKDELLTAMQQLQLLMDLKIGLERSNNWPGIYQDYYYETTSGLMRSTRTVEPEKIIHQCIVSLEKLRTNLNTSDLLDEPSLTYLKNNAKLIKQCYYYSLFDPIILMIRAFFRCVDIATTCGYTWDKAGYTPGAEALTSGGSSQFFTGSRRIQFERALEKFTRAQTKFKIALEKIPEADVVKAVAISGVTLNPNA